jgi:hypothetical protein
MFVHAHKGLGFGNALPKMPWSTAALLLARHPRTASLAPRSRPTPASGVIVTRSNTANMLTLLCSLTP